MDRSSAGGYGRVATTPYDADERLIGLPVYDCTMNEEWFKFLWLWRNVDQDEVASAVAVRDCLDSKVIGRRVQATVKQLTILMNDLPVARYRCDFADHVTSSVILCRQADDDEPAVFSVSKTCNRPSYLYLPHGLGQVVVLTLSFQPLILSAPNQCIGVAGTQKVRNQFPAELSIVDSIKKATAST